MSSPKLGLCAICLLAAIFGHYGTLESFAADFADATTVVLAGAEPSAGVAWGDYDNDGDLDLYISNADSNKLLRNDGDGIFVDATAGPLGDLGSGVGVAWGDYDNDGDLDLYIGNFAGYSPGTNKLLRNTGYGGFVDATTAPLAYAGSCQGVAWGDYDNDGDLDLYICAIGANKLLRNDGAGVFADATIEPLGDTGSGFGVAWGDYDDDGDLDLYICNYLSANKLLRNDGNGAFSDATSGPLGDVGSSVGAAWGDYDNDSDLDLYITNYEGANKLLRNEGAGIFSDATTGPIGDAGIGQGVAWGDYDNDGDLDLYIGNIGENKLLRNDGGGIFADVTSGPLGDMGSGFGVAWADYDNDGDLDLYVSNNGANKLLRNEQAAGNHWLHIDLVGVISNASGIGARVEIFAGSESQIREVSGGSGYLSQDSLIAEFGLGTTSIVDSLVVHWPSGIVNTYQQGIGLDTRITVGESQGGATAVDLPAGPLAAGHLVSATPNPFNPVTTITYSLSAPGNVTLVIYDLGGRRIRTLVNEHRSSRSYSVQWSGRDDFGRQVASGVYLYQLRYGNNVETKRVVLLK